LKPIWVLTLLASFFLTGADPNPKTSWRPRGTYWDAYRSVIIKAVCDTLGNIRHTELLYSAASPTETDSVMEVARQTRFDTKSYEGRVRKSKYEPVGKDQIEFIAQYSVPDKEHKTKPLITRKELENAGLAPWLHIWDRLLPDWPVETWSHTGSGDYFEYTSRIDHSMKKSLGMISVSPNQSWELDPFAGVDVTQDGKLDADVDGGFMIYPATGPGRVRQLVLGTPVTWCSGEWIDDYRFVVTANEETQLDSGVSYRAPVLYLGDVRSSKYTRIVGPSVPIGKTEAMWNAVNAYQEARYPKIANQLH
jgi:hypothetical protein